MVSNLFIFSPASEPLKAVDVNEVHSKSGDVVRLLIAHNTQFTNPAQPIPHMEMLIRGPELWPGHLPV